MNYYIPDNCGGTCYIGGDYCNPSFGEVFPSAADFLEGYKNCGITPLIKDETVNLLFYLLYAKYGSTPIRTNDTNLFAYKMYLTIFQYGPTWEKKMEIQEKLRSLSLEGGELFYGATAIHNHAAHDGSAPTTQTLTELPFIDNQNTTKYQKSKAEGLSILTDLLEADATEDFLRRFSRLFSQFLKPDKPALFITEAN